MSNQSRNYAPPAISVGRSVMAVDQGTLRSPEQLIDELSSLLSQDGEAGKPANSNEPPHARSYIIDDEEIDDAPVPIPSTWRAKPPVPVEKGWFAEQAWAAALGFVVGLIIVVPAILFLTARFGELGPVVGLEKDANGAQSSVVLQASTSVTGASVADPLSPSATMLPEQSPQPAPGDKLAVPAPIAAQPPASVELAPVGTVASAPPVEETGAPTLSDTATPSDTETAKAPAEPATAPSETTKQSAELPDVPRVAVIQVRPIPTTTTTNTEPQTDLTARLPTMEDVKHAIEAGKVQEARRALAQLATSGNGQAVFALAETYDPNMLAAWAITNIPADPAKARMFYSMALSRGVESARQRLMALD